MHLAVADRNYWLDIAAAVAASVEVPKVGSVQATDPRIVAAAVAAEEKTTYSHLLVVD